MSALSSRLGKIVRVGGWRAGVMALALSALTGGALAGFWYDKASDLWFYRKKVWKDDDAFKDIPLVGFSLKFGSPPPATESAAGTAEAAAPASLPKDIRNAVYQIDTSAFTVESGEPLAVSGLKRTGWRLFVPDRSGRVVISTYGSTRFGTAMDTGVGVYKKNADGTGKLIARGDDIPVAGGDKRASLVAFDAVKGARYAIQFGDKDAQGGDMLLTLFSFGIGGGLMVQPVQAAGGYDYSCTRAAGASGVCPAASYVVYNAAKTTLRVSVSADGLGSGAVVPKPFTLKPGAAAVTSVAFGAAFGATVGTRTGRFVFSGARDGKVAARTLAPARVAVHDGGGTAPDLLISASARTVAVQQGAVVPQIIDVKNADEVAASGCYVKPGLNETMMQTAWAGYDRAKRVVSGAPYAPFDLAPGKTVALVVAMRALRDRLADAAYERPFEIACASGPSFPATAAPDLSNVLDFTASVASFADVALVKTSPAGGVFTVAPKGSVMTATFRNDGESAAKLTARIVERSIHDSGGPKRYRVSVCSASTSDAECLKSTASALDVKATAGKTVTVKVGVRPPVQDPGYDRTSIGFALTLSQPYSATVPTAIPVAGVTRALKLK